MKSLTDVLKDPMKYKKDYRPVNKESYHGSNAKITASDTLEWENSAAGIDTNLRFNPRR